MFYIIVFAKGAIETDNKNKLLAAKRLSNTRIKISYGPFQFDTLWCRTAYNENETWTKKRHRHTFFELHYCLTGQCSYFISGNPVTLCSDTFLLLLPRVQHQVLSPSHDFSEMVMGFTLTIDPTDPEALAVGTALHEADSLKTYPALPAMRGCVQQMLETALEHPLFGGVTIAGLVQQLLLDIARQTASRSIALGDISHSREQDSRVKSILNFLHDNTRNSLTAADVSGNFNMSVKQLNRIVKSSTGLTLTQLIEQQKISVIKHLLETTDLSLFEIASKVGCSNEYNMNRFFKRIEGLPPGKYRISLKK